jgi:hypothetical protein
LVPEAKRVLGGVMKESLEKCKEHKWVLLVVEHNSWGRRETLTEGYALPGINAIWDGRYLPGRVWSRWV